MRAAIYDTALLPLTSGWYQEVLSRLPAEAHLLDVGIGTGGALCRNARLVREKSIRVTGVDIDPAYVERAQRRVARTELDDHVDVHLQSVYDHQAEGYDAVYFSASFMLLPDPVAALQHVMGLLNEDGRIYFTQTFEDRPSPFMERLKPLLKKLTTIDFGEVTYEEDFVETVESAGMELLSLETLGTRGPRSFRLAVGRPAVEAEGD